MEEFSPNEDRRGIVRARLRDGIYELSKALVYVTFSITFSESKNGTVIAKNKETKTYNFYEFSAQLDSLKKNSRKKDRNSEKFW